MAYTQILNDDLTNYTSLWDCINRSDDDIYYSVSTSLTIFRMFCECHDLDYDDICARLRSVIDEKGIMCFIGNRLCGHHFVFKTLFEVCMPHHVSVVTPKCRIVRSLDVPLLCVWGKNEDSVDISLLSSSLSTFVFYERAKNTTGIVLGECYAWNDAYTRDLNPRMWIDILNLKPPVNKCHGCESGHPSQKQHMGIGGCLNDDGE